MLNPLRAAVVAAFVLTAGCTAADPPGPPPGLAERGTTFTKATVTKQDLTAKVSLTGKVELNPVYGIAAPVDGEVRYLTAPDAGPVARETRVATVWSDGEPTRIVIPAGAEFAGRLVADRAVVVKGTPIVSVRHGGYAVAADIDGKQAYAIANGLKAVRAQIEGGPGPFACATLGTIAALPPGTVPEPPEPTAPPVDPTAPPTMAGPPKDVEPQPEPSEPTGMRLVCTAPSGTTLINGAPATVEVVTAEAKNVLVAPVEAVAGTQGKGQVDVIGPDGERVTTPVQLGLTDGKVVEIKSGLEGDETLAVPGPTLAAPEPTGEFGPGGP
ncbi:efflux RND transporter periplasmic adaptor subunit [Actinokineospora sp. UTMC 2448]|uniref:efflux RND transporter periplasmic adaptor subunit n=1 Tax=Actinokineospora sp. UTMC 2448 TaxID=2268449 RepID=UPI0021648C6B|nr:efflux RND transporter periplasmic adaptor subunit [Actinokineospora sp. UTMC 2448]UVS81262.1 efflux transporter, RND family, MFP subunit [Actinokineospora sp. UTMC 2448]